jgi:hypothetical protein
MCSAESRPWSEMSRLNVVSFVFILMMNDCGVTYLFLEGFDATEVLIERFNMVLSQVKKTIVMLLQEKRGIFNEIVERRRSVTTIDVL